MLVVEGCAAKSAGEWRKEERSRFLFIRSSEDVISHRGGTRREGELRNLFCQGKGAGGGGGGERRGEVLAPSAFYGAIFFFFFFCFQE